MRIFPVAAIIAAVSLAACGGGSGSSSPPAVPPASSTPGGAQPQSQVAQSSTDAAFAGSSAAEADQASSASNVGVLSLVSTGITPQSFGNLPYGTCVPDGTYAGIILAQPQVNGATTSYEITYFRDPKCSSEARDIKTAVTTSGKGSYSVSRNATNFDSSGNQLASRSSTISINGSKHNFSSQSSSVLSYGGATVGAAMDERTTAATATPGVDSFTGDGARITNGPAASYGASHAVGTGATKTANADGSVTYFFSTANTLFMGAAGSLAIAPATFPGPFSVTPSSDAIGTGSLTWSETFDANGLPTNLTINGTLAQGANITVTTSSGPPVLFNGAVTSPSGSSLATFQVDQFGNGSVSFADGTKRSIYDWHAFKS